MTEYIEREALSQAILDLPPKMDEQGYGWLGRRGVWQMVNDFPAADVRPVARGKWITHPRETWIGVDINGNETQPRQFFAYECPFCGFTTGISGKDYHFCPNCGARMEES